MNYKLIKIFFLFTGFLYGYSSHAQDSMHLSLNDAISMSLKNSHQLKLQTARIEEAIAAVKEAAERRLPSASASASYLRLAKPNIKLASAKDSAGSGNAGPSVNQALYGILNFSVPVYSGNRIKYGIEAARYLEQAAKLDAESDQPEIIANTIKAYLNIYKAKAATALVNESILQSQQRVKDFMNLEQNGLLARNDLLKAQLQLSNTELDLLNAENNFQFANIAMDIMLGLPENTIISTDSISAPDQLSLKTLMDYEQSAVQNRKEIQSVNFRNKAAFTQTKSIRAESLPGIALTGGYVAAYIPGLLTITNAVNVGVGVQYDISNLWKNGKLQQAKAREKQLSASMAQLNDEIRLQVVNSYQNYLLTKKKTEVYARAVEQAEENYRISRNKYENALLTTTELLDADVLQLQARLNLTAARADVVQAYYTLLQTTGLLNSNIKF